MLFKEKSLNLVQYSVRILFNIFMYEAMPRLFEDVNGSKDGNSPHGTYWENQKTTESKSPTGSFNCPQQATLLRPLGPRPLRSTNARIRLPRLASVEEQRPSRTTAPETIEISDISQKFFDPPITISIRTSFHV
jgi:hypothetical protein